MGELLTPQVVEILLISIRVSLVAMVFTVPIAIGVAYLLARKKFFGWSLLNAICFLPLVLPPVITGYLLLYAFSPKGYLGGMLERWFGIGFAFNWMGAALAAGVMAFPLVMRPIRLAFESQNKGLIETAKTLGASKMVGFWSISLPLALPGILAGAILGFAKALGEFGATITFVSNIPGETQTLALAVYSLSQSPLGDKAAITLVVLGVILSMLAIFLSEYFSSKMLKKREGYDA